jgi:hypothetical protein
MSEPLQERATHSYIPQCEDKFINYVTSMEENWITAYEILIWTCTFCVLFNFFVKHTFCVGWQARTKVSVLLLQLIVCLIHIWDRYPMYVWRLLRMSEWDGDKKIGKKNKQENSFRSMDIFIVFSFLMLKWCDFMRLYKCGSSI